MSAKDSPAPASETTRALSEACNHLAINLYKLLAKDEENVFISPFSISIALAMVFCGAEDETAAEMRSALGYEAAKIRDSLALKNGFQGLLEVLGRSPESYALACANSLVIRKGFEVKSGFKALVEELFKALLQEADFSLGTEEAVGKVNDFVRDKTNGMIPQLLDGLDELTVLVVLNAVYFKGNWLHQFKENHTFMQYFYNKGLEDENELIEMMHLKEHFAFAERESFKSILLPYRGEDIAMQIFLPKSKDGLQALESQLSVEFIHGLRQEMYVTEVEVALPKFKLEYSKSMRENFQELGVVKAFNSGAHFGAINDQEDLHVSEIIHKAVLIVNEEGCEAAAATAVSISLMCIREVPEFVVDRPFAFIIFDKRNELVLFMGRVEQLGKS